MLSQFCVLNSLLFIIRESFMLCRLPWHCKYEPLHILLELIQCRLSQMVAQCRNRKQKAKGFRSLVKCCCVFFFFFWFSFFSQFPSELQDTLFLNHALSLIPVIFNFILHDRRKGPIWNVIMWTSLFLGQGVLLCLYSQEWYAQKHCPISNVSVCK